MYPLQGGLRGVFASQSDMANYRVLTYVTMIQLSLAEKLSLYRWALGGLDSISTSQDQPLGVFFNAY